MNYIPQISVIIPVYNVEKYLPQCIESVLAQTFKDFELLLINDGSKDLSGKICDEYAKKDSRIQVYHQTNQGVGAARNVGIDHARCEWLCIIDSDDYLGKDYLATFMNQGHLVEDCFNLQGWQCINEQNQITEIIKYPHLITTENTITETIAQYHLFSNNAPWAKLFNRNIIKRHNLRYPLNLPVREDAIFSYNYRMYIKDIQLLSNSEYYYRLPGKRITLSHSIHRPEVFLYIRENLPPLIQKVFQRFHLQGNNYEQQVISYFKNQTALSIIKSIYAYPIPRSERLKILHTLFDDHHYFNDPVFHLRSLLKLFRLFCKFLSPGGFDLFCYLPFRFYYKYIRL